jgi:hypothetical protein
LQNTHESRPASQPERARLNAISAKTSIAYLLEKKISSVRHPMQELELNYPTTEGKVYSEEEDRYLFCRLFHYKAKNAGKGKVSYSFVVSPALNGNCSAETWN